MIARIRQRLRQHDDAGVTLVEVIVAMMIFALVSTGFVYTMLSVLSLTRDSRSRGVAANLAAEEIDLARDAEDLFDLVDESRAVELNGDTFQVVRRASWVTDPDEEFSCGGAGGLGGGDSGQLRYKRISVEVTWGGMRSGTEPVRSTTVINPDQRLNDPNLGTIIVSVLDGAGLGSQGISIGASPSVGSVISATDAQGCTYVLKVPPDDYTISVSRSGYIDSSQNTTSSQAVTVVGGQSATVGFQYDRAATFTTTLAANAPAGTAVRVPTNLQTTFANTYGTFGRTPSSGGGTLTQRFPLHPFSSGYEVFAGTCVAADPLQWPEEVVGSQTFRADRQPAVAATPGGAASTGVAMGIVTVRGGSSSVSHLKAVSVNPTTPGLPGCASTQTLAFGDVIRTGSGTIALPYGTWQLYRGGSGAQNTPVPAADIQPTVPAKPERTTVAPDGKVTLDPRVAVVAP
ncbi:type IV pilus modification PilV family protein [Cellulomonas pakistanensis]|uniref:Prepilin-type N-terminal cleavage/methylation domain-containing protein n=1 Tax=Cellulomonas pakistanensis TaxID=992287 RepID=A0A919PBB6_9CELL|nr:prepilin-type N-terminal cleavage/methylation domain-containing protein [Cellulomonas pakistanensis]GIG35117.1 hypothetical protein Cpa01nite_04980 [Cellulomonas pakistanensis]